jgi:hypothetical protein
VTMVMISAQIAWGDCGIDIAGMRSQDFNQDPACGGAWRQLGSTQWAFPSVQSELISAWECTARPSSAASSQRLVRRRWSGLRRVPTLERSNDRTNPIVRSATPFYSLLRAGLTIPLEARASAEPLPSRSWVARKRGGRGKGEKNTPLVPSLWLGMPTRGSASF